jgi:hypothetical protein
MIIISTVGIGVDIVLTMFLSLQLTLLDDDSKSQSAGRFRIETGDLEGSEEVSNGRDSNSPLWMHLSACF